MFDNECCFACKHFRGMLKNSNICCEAFPQGIPTGYFCKVIFVRRITKDSFVPPSECANGVMFELKDNYEDPWERAERLRKEGYDVPE